MFIYIITCKGFCKIGYAKDIKVRVAAIQTCCPFKISLHSHFEVPPSRSASLIEQWSHFALKEFWTKIGEWFHVSPGRASSIIRQAFSRNDTVKPNWHTNARPEQRSKAAKILWSNMAFRKRMAKVLMDNRNSQKLKDGLAASWTDERRAKMSAKVQKLWKTKAYRAKMKLRRKK